MSERKQYRLEGLIPATVRTRDEQVQHVIKCLDVLFNGDKDNLNKYCYLRELQDTDSELFYLVLQRHTAKVMPLIYTPTVGLACQQYSLIYQRPRGLFITMDICQGMIDKLLANYWEQEVKAIVVTDGERILGLGDLGANGMGIPVGKIALYTAVGGLPPQNTLPITLDVGTNNQTLLDDPLYIGSRRRRPPREQYDAFVDEFMRAVTNRWGTDCLVQFEDFGNANAARLLYKYQNKYCIFNDDIQGTAAVAVAGLMAALRLTDNKKIADNRYLFYGAGEAALGIADLLILAIKNERATQQPSFHSAIYNSQPQQHCISMFDSQGLITPDRITNGEKNAHKELYATTLMPHTKVLNKVLNFTCETKCIQIMKNMKFIIF